MNEKISVKSREEIEIMKKGGKIAALVLSELKKALRPGISTLELDLMAEKLIERAGAKPSFKDFHGYPAVSCISVNDEVVHGIPSSRVLEEGDLVGIDMGVLYQGYHSDTAITCPVGKVTPEAQKLLNVTKEALNKAISIVKPGIHLGDVQAAIQKVIEDAGFGVVRDLSGHGIGKNLQEAPSIPNFGKKGQGIVLQEGYTIAIEPMVTVGDWHVIVTDDGWTVKTKDGSLAAHFEHTIAVTANGAEVLTKE